MPGWGHTEFLSKEQGTYCGSKPSLRGKEWIPRFVSCAHNQARWPSWKAARQQGRALTTSTALPEPEVWGPPGPDHRPAKVARGLPLNRSGIQSYTSTPGPASTATSRSYLPTRSGHEVLLQSGLLAMPSGKRAGTSQCAGWADEGQWSLKTPLVATSCRIPQSCHTEPQRQRHSKKLQQVVNIHKNKYCKRKSSHTLRTHSHFSFENPAGLPGSHRK